MGMYWNVPKGGRGSRNPQGKPPAKGTVALHSWPEYTPIYKLTFDVSRTRLKVLNLVQLSEKMLKGKATVQEFRDMTWTGERLGSSDLPSRYVRRYGQPAAGVPRAELNLALKEELLRKGIPLHEGWRLQDIEETETGVVAISADGRRVTGSFLVGCDGLRGISRDLLLRRKGVVQGPATFTGLTQVCFQVSPSPQAQGLPADM